MIDQLINEIQFLRFLELVLTLKLTDSKCIYVESSRVNPSRRFIVTLHQNNDTKLMQ